MCGICGIFETGGRNVPRTLLKSMSDTISHRGPDDDGFYTCGGIGLAHRRLSIIDVEGGHQPLSNEDESIWIAFNGEIYNFEELNRRYLSTGHHVQDALRHRDHRAPLRGAWRSLLCRDARHVRAGLVGRTAETSAAGPRPPRQEAAVLLLGWPTPGVRLRDQSVVESGRAIEGDRSGGTLRLLLLSLCPGAQDDL